MKGKKEREGEHFQVDIFYIFLHFTQKGSHFLTLQLYHKLCLMLNQIISAESDNIASVIVIVGDTEVCGSIITYHSTFLLMGQEMYIKFLQCTYAFKFIIHIIQCHFSLHVIFRYSVYNNTI